MRFTLEEIDQRVRKQLREDYRMATIAKDLGVSKSTIIKSMKRVRQMMPVSCFCASITGCKITCCEKDGLFLTGGCWYCYICYGKWPNINHAEVKYYTRAGVEGSEERCNAALKKLKDEHDYEQEFYNKSLGVPFVDDNPICSQCKKNIRYTKDVSEGELTPAGGWICSPCVQHLQNRAKIRTFPMYTEVSQAIHGSEMSRLIRMTSKEFADLKDRVARDIVKHSYNPCGEITLEPDLYINSKIFTDDVKRLRSSGWSIKKLSQLLDRPEKFIRDVLARKRVVPVSSIHDEITVLIQPLECPKGWDTISYYGQAFLRFDGVMVYQNKKDKWCIDTKRSLIEVNETFLSHLEAMAAADEHIPMGELL